MVRTTITTTRKNYRKTMTIIIITKTSTANQITSKSKT